MLDDCAWKRSKARQRNDIIIIITKFLCGRLAHKTKQQTFEAESLFLPTNTHY
jgi:hypothetical protein